MTQFIALITDAAGAYATVAVQANTWSNAVNQLEDAGCEVIEDQSEDYEGYWPEDLRDMDVLTINELLSHEDFVAHAWQHLYTDHATTPTHMELLNQIDVANPDHVSVITRSGRITISVKKDGAEIMVGFPIKDQVFNTTPRPPLQQPAPKLMAVKETVVSMGRRTKPVRFHNNKLTEADVREIKAMLCDDGIMSKFKSKHQAHIEIGKAYKVSSDAIANISNGRAWAHINWWMDLSMSLNCSTYTLCVPGILITDVYQDFNYSIAIQTMTYSQPELDRIESQATADYMDAMADLAYEMCNALREEYEDDHYEDAAI